MKRVSELFVGLGALAVAAVSGVATAEAGTLDVVKSRGQLVCGVNTNFPGFSSPDEKGQWSGLDVDYCKALAVVALGDASKVKYVPLTAKERLTALVFPAGHYPQTDAVEVVVHRLRKKLDGTGVQLTTLRGLGYLLQATTPGAAVHA